ncbi:MAG: SatD family protein [Candidatus Izemoplasmatales bacterium]|nr:SatD family protein [Candidatus Izemoplasmatales bacterium]
MSEYFAIIIDLTKSRRMNEEERFDAQKKLRDSIEIINNLHRNDIVKSMSFSGGDSIQGLFKNIQAAFNTFFLIENLVFPFSVRCGIGIGKVNEQLITKFQTDDSNAYDGKAYHLARNGIDLAKKYQYKFYINSDSDKDIPINSLINDDKFIFMTLTRKAIFSIVNLIEPIIVDDIKVDYKYNESIPVFIREITNYYRERSRVKKRVNFFAENKFNSIDDTEVKDIITQSKQSLFFEQDFTKYDLKDVLFKNDSTISPETRDILVKLTESSYQNISSMIKTSNMDELRKKYIAKLMMLKHLYEGADL